MFSLAAAQYHVGVGSFPYSVSRLQLPGGAGNGTLPHGVPVIRLRTWDALLTCNPSPRPALATVGIVELTRSWENSVCLSLSLCLMIFNF